MDCKLQHGRLVKKEIERNDIKLENCLLLQDFYFNLFLIIDYITGVQGVLTSFAF